MRALRFSSMRRARRRRTLNEDGRDNQDQCAPSGNNETQPTEKAPYASITFYEQLSPRWKNYVVRLIFTVMMIGGFCFLVWLGPLALTFLILIIQMKCFHEIISIGHMAYKANNLPWFRLISWYFLFASNVYFFGESLTDYFGTILAKNNFGQTFLAYHTMISFFLYTAGFITFVLQLKKRFYMKQFTLFGLTHVTLLLIVIQSHLMMKSLLEGLIWFLMPVSLIICNDIFAYIFGFFFGRTRLIKLSPKKTWEGFIGGAITTIVYGFIMSGFLSKFKYFVCPIAYVEGTDSFTMDCTPSSLFRLTSYQLPFPFTLFAKSVALYPFQFHTLFLSLFASLICPFGGFFASGFKRAFKIKDFSDTIPGHGGFMDRFDCQVVMGAFTYVWIITFVRSVTPQKLFKLFLSLNKEGRTEFLSLIRPYARL